MNKWSRYNYLYDNGENFILFNLASKAYLALVPQLAKLIEEKKDNIGTLSTIHPELCEILKEKGFIIDSGLDEVETLLKRWRDIESSKKSYSIIVLPTLDCNCRCWYCYEQHNAGTNMTPQTVELIKKHIDLKTSDPELQHFHLSFFGGEPLMGFHTVVMPLLKYAKEICQKRSIGYDAHFTTNASLLTDKMISEMKDLNISIGFQITLDGNRKTHDSIRCTKTGKPTFDTIVANIHKLLRNGFRVSLRINYTTANIDTNYDIIDEFKDLSDGERGLLKVNFQQVWQDMSNVSKPFSKVEKVQSVFEKHKLCTHTGLLKSCSCYADCENSIVINYNGDIYKCTARDFLQKNREGVLCEDGHVAFNEKYKKRMQVKHSIAVCKQCNVFPICAAMCSQHDLECANATQCFLGLSETEKKAMTLEHIKSLK